MAAFVVVDPSAPSSVPLTGTRLGIFPGAASPSVFRAGAAFWIGYGFIPEPAVDGGKRALEPDTRFELAVDGEFVELVTDLESSNGSTVQKQSVATFPAGLPAGWHCFRGRWYVAGKLVLSSDRSIEFVER